MFGSTRFMALLAVATTAFVVLLAPGATGSALWKNSGDVERIVEIGENNNKVMEHLDHLCNTIGARPAGSRNHQEASEWAYEKFKDFGLSNVHLEQCGFVPAYPNADWSKGLLEKLSMAEYEPDDDATTERLVPVYNVVADIPGNEKPDEYVILGAHFDSVPIGTGALDNGAGVAAIMEAARILVESGAKPKRTIRFVLFAGEESGLVGSRGYIEAHPDLLPKISAMYNMDAGTHYISGITVTEPLQKDMEEIFAPVTRLDQAMSFDVELADYLPMGDPNCCQKMGRMISLGEDDGVVYAQVCKRNPDGSLEPVAKDLEGIDLSANGTPARGDSVVKRLISLGACGGEKGGIVQGKKLTVKDLEQLGILSEIDMIEGADTTVTIQMGGGSDHVVFLAKGVPAFWWKQEGDTTVVYPVHTKNDTFDKAIPEYLEHSATVMALGALGTANLDHMLSRERLTKPAAAEEASLAVPDKTETP